MCSNKTVYVVVFILECVFLVFSIIFLQYPFLSLLIFVFMLLKHFISIKQCFLLYLMFFIRDCLSLFCSLFELVCLYHVIWPFDLIYITWCDFQLWIYCVIENQFYSIIALMSYELLMIFCEWLTCCDDVSTLPTNKIIKLLINYYSLLQWIE